MEDHGRKLKIQKESYAPLMVCIYQDAFQLITEDVFITILDIWNNTCYPEMNDECIVSPVERMNDFAFNIELLRAMAMLRKLFKLLFLSISIIFLIKVSSAQCSNKTTETCLQPTFTYFSHPRALRNLPSLLLCGGEWHYLKQKSFWINLFSPFTQLLNSYTS
jgi:hypothetical protein